VLHCSGQVRIAGDALVATVPLWKVELFVMKDRPNKAIDSAGG